MKKVSFTVNITEDLLEKARNHVYWTPGLSLSGFIEEIIRKELDDEDIEERPERLKRGRRPS